MDMPRAAAAARGFYWSLRVSRREAGEDTGASLLFRQVNVALTGGTQDIDEETAKVLQYLSA
jgi:hypothetical protein